MLLQENAESASVLPAKNYKWRKGDAVPRPADVHISATPVTQSTTGMGALFCPQLRSRVRTVCLSEVLGIKLPFQLPVIRQSPSGQLATPSRRLTARESWSLMPLRGTQTNFRAGVAPGARLTVA